MQKKAGCSESPWRCLWSCGFPAAEMAVMGVGELFYPSKSWESQLFMLGGAAGFGTAGFCAAGKPHLHSDFRLLQQVPVQIFLPTENFYRTAINEKSRHRRDGGSCNLRERIISSLPLLWLRSKQLFGRLPLQLCPCNRLSELCSKPSLS